MRGRAKVTRTRASPINLNKKFNFCFFKKIFYRPSISFIAGCTSSRLRKTTKAKHDA
jgi:hypothetical protein